ncbi:MAG TPA: prolyl oligopeptidase family serine peptidase [Acidimicrobiales bacterium]|jgi:prolyl oligopeptidase|nr:prolyl oligopeptidase family serine peptidase [Acidimicrobiales bacterium]
MSLPYPAAPRADLVENLHGEPISDPYRPLEDPDAPETVDFVTAQNALTESVLSAIPTRGAIRERIAEMWDYPKRGVPFERAGQWFQMRNSGLQPQSVLYAMDEPGAPGRILIDPNAMSEDGTASLTGLGVSRDGNRVAWAVSHGGSDWMTWRVRSVDTGEDLDDVVQWSKFGGAAWTHDGFFYSSVEQPPAGEELVDSVRRPRIAFHRLGSDQSDDQIEFEAPDRPDWIPHAGTTEDGRYLVVTVSRGTGTETYVLVRDLTEPGSVLAPLNPEFEAMDSVVDHAGDGSFFVHTDRDAERGRVVRARPGVPAAAWAEVVAESADTLSEVHLIGGHLVCHYLRDAQSAVSLFSLDGVPVAEVPVPGPASVAEISGRPGSTLMHYQVTSYIQSGAIHSYDLATGRTELVTPSAARFPAERYLTTQEFVTSDDGTRIPVFLTRARSLSPAGDAPVLLYGYGGFNVPLTPGFSVTFAAWLDRGGVVAVANLRGGGEYGRAWHDAGRLARKQNVFDDFAACARWLGSSGWSRPDRVAIMGGSNGGLLVGASVTQRPELFGAAVAEVGVMDMLRFHKFTIGWAWKADYGDPDDPEQFRWVRAYSPLHNIEAGRCYPPMLIMTGDHDDRVVPAHSLKFAATLQKAQGCDHPILLRVATSGGHGAGKPTQKLIEEAADRLAFLESVLLDPSGQ